MRVVGSTIAVVGLVVMVVVAPRASAQEECSCTEKDPATGVELEITATAPRDHSTIGPEQETPVVDLRGEQTVLVGDAPELLDGANLSEVPVLMAVAADASGADECSEEQPPSGSDLSVTGQVYMEETGPVVWTGPCQGTLTIATGAPEESTDDDWEAGLKLSAAILAGVAIVCLALAPLTARGKDPDDGVDVDP